VLRNLVRERATIDRLHARGCTTFWRS
jgi:hypothetical protein